MVAIEELKHTILVFKTNISENLEHYVRAILDTFSEIERIDFDFEDADKILRIEAVRDIALEVELVLNSRGFYCGELQ